MDAFVLLVILRDAVLDASVDDGAEVFRCHLIVIARKGDGYREVHVLSEQWEHTGIEQRGLALARLGIAHREVVAHDESEEFLRFFCSPFESIGVIFGIGL